MSDITAHVYEEDIVVGYTGGIDEVANRVEPSVHPAGPAQTIDGHVIVELLRGEWIQLGDFEEMQVRVEAQL